MAKELFKPHYSPSGMAYADAKATGTLRESETWWIRVRHSASAICGCKTSEGRLRRGVPHTFRESTKTTHKPIAQQQLDAHKKELAKGSSVGKRSEQPTFGDMAIRLRRDYELNGKHVATLDARLKHLVLIFGHRRMTDIQPDDIEAYKEQRHIAGAANGTINRELAALSRAFSLACDLQLLTIAPRMRKFKEAAARSGFFENESYALVMKHLPSDDLRLACAISHQYGWRIRSEVLTLERRHIRLDEPQHGTLRLDAGATKNDDPRVIYLTPALQNAIRDQLARLDQWEAGRRRTPYLFTHTSGRHEGQRIKEFTRAWQRACLEAELDGLTGELRQQRKAELLAHPSGLMKALRHDFRRTAVRNMMNLGIAERVAMKITGHRSPNVFKRYHIVNPADLQEATRRLSSMTAPLVQANGVNES
jgi:site-specific recombinase XerD